MPKTKTIYQEEVDLFAKFGHPQSDDYLDYRGTIQIKDSGKLPVLMEMKFDGLFPSYAPMPPETHVFRAKNLIDLFLKLTRWFRKYGYELK